MDGLLASMSCQQLRGWMAYAQIDPFGNERGDLQAAMVKQAVLNTMGRGEDDDPFELDDCMPKFGESKMAKARREKEKAREVQGQIQDTLGGL